LSKADGKIGRNRPVFITGEGQEVDVQFLRPFHVRFFRTVREDQDTAAAFSRE
jgi:hypothetical protein